MHLDKLDSAWFLRLNKSTTPKGLDFKTRFHMSFVEQFKTVPVADVDLSRVLDLIVRNRDTVGNPFTLKPNLGATKEFVRAAPDGANYSIVRNNYG
jgi:hypothetical protein